MENDQAGSGGVGGAGGSQGSSSQNIDQLQQLFEQFSSTLVKLRAASTEGQQKVETARVRPQ